MNAYDKVTVKGEGGKGGSGGNTPVEDPNSLFSKGVVRVVDLLSEGEIKGLVDGAKSIYLDDVPLQNADGTYNYEGVGYGFLPGTPDQEPLPGFRYAASTVPVGVRVKQGQHVVRRIVDLTLDAVVVSIQIPALTLLDEKTGDLHGSTVEFAIDVKDQADALGTYTNIYTETIRGKTVSTYLRDYRLELEGTGPWDIRVRRLTADADNDAKLSNDTYWGSIVKIHDNKLIYPDSAVIGLEVDSEFFGSKLPTRSFEVYGLIMLVPSNYDADAKTYDEASPWDGTFKYAYTNSPAWFLYNAVINKRWGLVVIVDQPGLH